MQVRITPVIATLVRQSATKNCRSVKGEVNFQLERVYEPASTRERILECINHRPYSTKDLQKAGLSWQANMPQGVDITKNRKIRSKKK